MPAGSSIGAVVTVVSWQAAEIYGFSKARLQIYNDPQSPEGGQSCVAAKQDAQQHAQTPKTTAGAPGVSEDGNDGGYNAGIAVFSYIIGGIIVWSLIGWGLDNLWGTRWIVLAGALLGAAGRVLSFSYARPHRRQKARGGDNCCRGPSEDEEQ